MRQRPLLAILPPAHRDFWTVLTPKLRLPGPAAVLVADGFALVSVAPRGGERKRRENR